jgi:cell division protein FtsQ
MWQRIKQYRYLLVMSGLLITGVSVWQWLANTHYFPIRHVTVQSTYRHVTPEELAEVVNPYLHKSFFGLSISGLKRSILQIPWVSDAMVKRVWPDTIDIQFTEQVAVAKWWDHALMNEDGVLFFPEISFSPDGLPVFSGPVGSELQVFRTYKDMASLLAEPGLTIARVSVSDRYAWTVYLTDGTELILGREKPIRRLKRFVAVYDQLFANQTRVAESVDLRYPDGLAVRWQ